MFFQLIPLYRPNPYLRSSYVQAASWPWGVIFERSPSKRSLDGFQANCSRAERGAIVGIGDKWVETNKGLRVRFFIEYVQDHVKMDQIFRIRPSSNLRPRMHLKSHIMLCSLVLTLKDENSLRNTFEPY